MTDEATDTIDEDGATTTIAHEAAGDMTMLEHFTGAALTGLCGSDETNDMSTKQIAELAVSIGLATVTALDEL